MIIRAKQISAFRDSLRESFLRRMTEHLRRDFPADLARNGIANSELEGLVRKEADSAEEYGISSERHLRLYLECIALLGADFEHKDAVVSEILTREVADAGEKMSAINEYLIFGAEEPR